MISSTIHSQQKNPGSARSVSWDAIGRGAVCTRPFLDSYESGVGIFRSQPVLFLGFACR